MDDEIHTLTENLFEEAYKMVDEAKGNKVVTDKLHPSTPHKHHHKRHSVKKVNTATRSAVHYFLLTVHSLWYAGGAMSTSLLEATLVNIC